MKLRPLKDKIVVKPQPRARSEFLILDLAPEADTMGTVVAVGPGRKLPNGRFEEMPVKVGDKVLFGTIGKQSRDDYLKFQEYMEDGERYLIMSWQDICFTEEPENAAC